MHALALVIPDAYAVVVLGALAAGASTAAFATSRERTRQARVDGAIAETLKDQERRIAHLEAVDERRVTNLEQHDGRARDGR